MDEDYPLTKDSILEEMSENVEEMIQDLVNKEKMGFTYTQEDLEQIKKEENYISIITQLTQAIPIKELKERVIYVNGDEELSYHDRQFFLGDTKDARKIKRKIGKKEATDRFIEYYIRFVLNPAIEKKNANQRGIARQEKQKVPNKLESKEKVGSKEEIKERAKKPQKDQKVKQKKVKEQDEIIR